MAFQTLSKSVGLAFEHHLGKKEIGQFLQKFDECLDTLNSRKFYDSNPFRRPLGLHPEQFDRLDFIINEFSMMR